MENLTDLQVLDLGGNQIEEISGLKHFTDLQELDLLDNPIKADEMHLLKRSTQEIVRYCQEKVEKVKTEAENT